jgi:putative ABC transport system permease protein
MGTLWQDLRQSVRMLFKRPGLTVAVVIVLALSIGANCAIFSVVSAALLRPIPWADPERIVSVHETDLKRGLDSQIVSPANYLDWRDESRSFEQMAGWRFLYLNLAGRDQPERVQGLTVSASYFPLLGVKAALGRTFLAEEEQAGRDRVVVLSDGLWQRRFGSDPNIVGQKITVEGEPYTVVGVLPHDFWVFRVLNRELDMYVPLALERGQLSREDQSIFVYARLKPGVSLEQAEGEMNALQRSHEQGRPEISSGRGVRLVPLPEQWTERIRPTLLMLLAAVGFVLLIACANIANLLLARATVRQKEMAIRTALGATRLRLVRQLLTESVLLAVLGGAAGLLLAYWSIDLLNHLIPYTAVNRVGRFELDGQVLRFTFLLTLVTGVVFGLAPALRSSRLDLTESLKEGGSSTTGAHGRRLLGALVVSEIALAVLLLIGAGLLIRSSLRMQKMDRGLNPHHVLTMQVWLPRAKYAESHQVTSFYQQALRRIGSLPGVESASAINFPPLAVQYTTVPFNIEGDAPAATPEEMATARYSIISPSYFQTMQIPLLAGRPFTEEDSDETRGVVVISRSMAERFWPAGDWLGKRIQPQFPKQQKTFWLPESRNLPLTVVGVVADVRQEGINDSHLPQMYLPYLQNPSSIMNVLVRTAAASDPLSYATAVRREIYAVDQDQPVFDIKTMEMLVAESFAQPRVFASLLASFAALALLLAAVGIYGMMSYSVTQRTHEIGIRVALGAQERDVLKLVIGEGLKLVLVGVAIGLIGAFVTTRILSSLLFGTSPTDPAIFTVVALLLTAIALAACYIPARRAMRVDPMVALRHD